MYLPQYNSLEVRAPIFIVADFNTTYDVNFRARMRKLLNGGTTLIVDRYAFSGVAYSAAKDV